MTNFRQKLAFSAASAFQFPFLRLYLSPREQNVEKARRSLGGLFVYGRNNLKDAS